MQGVGVIVRTVHDKNYGFILDHVRGVPDVHFKRRALLDIPWDERTVGRHVRYDINPEQPGRALHVWPE